jgi:hypothetical protein
MILPHFFNARGAPLERSVEGMYRTLTVWLLDELPRVITESLAAVYLAGHEPESWPLGELERLLKDAIGNMNGHPMAFYIDALDECPREEVQRMLDVFRDLVRKTWDEGHEGKVRMCFASRPYPNITFHDALFIDLGSHPEHSLGISTYIDDRLRIGESDLAVQIRRTIHEKAAGICMWATLVVREMSQEYDDGNVHRLQLHLEHIPATLHNLYRHTLERYPQNHDALLVCLRWKLFAFDKLNTMQLWWGIQVELDRDEADFIHEYRQFSQLDMARQIVSISCGLLVYRSQSHLPDGITPSTWTPPSPQANDRRSYVVAFAHESVRDFVFKEEALHGERNRDTFVAQSHVLLRDWCFSELNKRQKRTQQVPSRLFEEGPESRMESVKWKPRYPLATYAAKYTIYHSEASERHGRDQTLFIRPLATNPEPAALICYDPYFRATRGELLQLLIISGSASLIARTQLKPARDARQSRKAFLIRPDTDPAFDDSRVVLSRDSPEAVQALLNIYLELEPRQYKLQQILTGLLTSAGQVDVRVTRTLAHAEPTLLDLPRSYSTLASFFLLALAFPDALEPHLDNLEKIALSDAMLSRGSPSSFSAWPQFLRLMQYFIMNNICSDAIDLKHPDLKSWYGNQLRSLDVIHEDVVLSSGESRRILADTEAFLRSGGRNRAW